MMAETMTAVNAPYLTAVREALDVVARIEERLKYAERIARIEERLDQLERRLEREGRSA